MGLRFLIYFNQPGLTSFPIDNTKMGSPKAIVGDYSFTYLYKRM